MKLKEVKGVGSKTEEYLHRLGLYTAEDALLNRPRRYEDRKNLRYISDESLSDASFSSSAWIFTETYLSRAKHSTSLAN